MSVLFLPIQYDKGYHNIFEKHSKTILVESGDICIRYSGQWKYPT